MRFLPPTLPTIRPLGLAALGIALALGGRPALSLPFGQNAAEFEAFVQQVWKNQTFGGVEAGVNLFTNNPNDSRRYWGFYNCTWSKPETGNVSEKFSCDGYLERTTPLGNWRCPINATYYHALILSPARSNLSTPDDRGKWTKWIYIRPTRFWKACDL